MERKNVFLDFMGPDMWKTIPSFQYSDHHRIQVLSMSLNIAVLMTAEYCILPPAFIAQSRIAREAMRAKAEYLNDKLIVFPLKESSLEYYFEKKQREYSYVKDTHSEFYKKAGHKFIGKYSGAIIQRNTSMGLTIADKWIEIPDDSDIWQPIVRLMPERADSIRRIPAILKSHGTSITLEAVKKEAGINGPTIDFSLNQAIQHEYLMAYLKEYNATIIEDIPPKPIRLNFLIKTDSIYYNYYVFEEVLAIAGLDGFLKNASANTIINVRKIPEFVRFMDLYWEVCHLVKEYSEIKLYFSELMTNIPINKPSLMLTYIPFSSGTNLLKIKNILNALLEKSTVLPFDSERYNYKHESRKGISMHNNRIFIVHGHNTDVRNDVEMLCRRIGLDPIILAEQANNGLTIIEKLEKYSDVYYSIILYTCCDEGRLIGTTELNKRARQNVVFEHGYMIAKLGRNKVIALVEKDVEVPGDLGGIVYISLEAKDWKNQVMRELDSAGFEIDWSKA